MLWWVNGVIHRKNSFATFPAKLHTSEATLSFKNYKPNEKKTKTNSRFVMHHSPFPSHLNSPLSTHLFSCRGDWNRYTKIRYPQGDWRPSLPFSSGQIGFSLPLILPLHLNKRLFPPFTNHFPV